LNHPIDDKEILDRLKEFYDLLISTQNLKSSKKDLAYNFNLQMPEGYKFLLKILMYD
jgi:hypothetical protein